jgi:hypothetical protein
VKYFRRALLFASFGRTGAFPLPSRSGQVILYVLYFPNDCRMCSKANGFLRIIRKEQFRFQFPPLNGSHEALLIGLQAKESADGTLGTLNKLAPDGSGIGNQGSEPFGNVPVGHARFKARTAVG